MKIRTLAVILAFTSAAAMAVPMITFGGIMVEKPVAVNQAEDGSSFILTVEPCGIPELQEDYTYRAAVYIKDHGNLEGCWALEKGKDYLTFGVVTLSGMIAEGALYLSDFKKFPDGGV